MNAVTDNATTTDTQDDYKYYGKESITTFLNRSVDVHIHHGYTLLVTGYGTLRELPDHRYSISNPGYFRATIDAKNIQSIAENIVTGNVVIIVQL